MNDNKDLESCCTYLPCLVLTGIGTMGKEAYAFVDFLSGLHLGWWQVLPLVQTVSGILPISRRTAVRAIRISLI